MEGILLAVKSLLLVVFNLSKNDMGIGNEMVGGDQLSFGGGRGVSGGGLGFASNLLDKDTYTLGTLANEIHRGDEALMQDEHRGFERTTDRMANGFERINDNIKDGERRNSKETCDKQMHVMDKVCDFKMELQKEICHKHEKMLEKTYEFRLNVLEKLCDESEKNRQTCRDENEKTRVEMRLFEAERRRKEEDKMREENLLLRFAELNRGRDRGVDVTIGNLTTQVGLINSSVNGITGILQAALTAGLVKKA